MMISGPFYADSCPCLCQFLSLLPLTVPLIYGVRWPMAGRKALPLRTETLFQKGMQQLFKRFCGCLAALAVMAPGCRAQTASPEWKAGRVVTAEAVKRAGESHWFSQEPLPDGVFARMRGYSYPEDCSVARSELRYLRVIHYDVDGRVRMGELVCNRAIADDLLAIFHELYRQRYPIHSLRLIDDFGADDERSMRANNSSCFCYRVVKGAKRLSAHARGMAVDLNTLYNPCVRQRGDRIIVQPATARAYCDRSATFPYKIDRHDLAYRLFVQHGFKWGGAWCTVKDYQHFEK